MGRSESVVYAPGKGGRGVREDSIRAPPLKGRDSARRVSNVCRAAPESEMSRNHRFFNRSFNGKATRARMGLESLKCGAGCPRAGNEPKSSFL